MTQFIERRQNQIGYLQVVVGAVSVRFHRQVAEREQYRVAGGDGHTPDTVPPVGVGAGVARAGDHSMVTPLKYASTNWQHHHMNI